MSSQLPQAFAIYTDNLDRDSELIRKITKDTRNMPGQVIFCDGLNSYKMTDYPVFPSFYMRFFADPVIFLNMEDYVQFKDTIIAKSMLYVDSQNINPIDRSIIDLNDIIAP